MNKRMKYIFVAIGVFVLDIAFSFVVANAMVGQI